MGSSGYLRIAEHLGRDGSEQIGGEIDDPHSGKRAGRSIRPVRHRYDLGSLHTHQTTQPRIISGLTNTILAMKTSRMTRSAWNSFARSAAA